MKVPGYLVISELLLPTKGGTAVWFAEVYGRLNGKETHIVTADVPHASDFDASHPNTVHRLNLRRYLWLKPESLLAYLRLFGHTLALGLRHRFKAAHAGRVLPEGMVGWLVARLVRVPFVVYAHGEEITGCRNPRKQVLMRFIYRHADCVIANSDFTRDVLIGLGVEPLRIAVIAPGVDTQRFQRGLPCDDLRKQIGLLPGQRLILSVGRLQRRKGFDQVIRVLPDLISRGLDVHYAIIGIGVDADYLQELAEGLNLESRVHLLGHVPAGDLPRWYNAATVFAMPNRDIAGDTEGFGMVYIEAAACGVPSLAGRAGGTGGAVLDGVTGLRVDGESINEIGDALYRLFTDSEYAQTLAEQGWQRALEEFSWESVARKTLALDSKH